MSTEKIPKSDSIQELAQFWDDRDLTDFEDQLEEVTEPVFEGKTFVKIDLHPQVMQAVKEIAKLRGISYIDLMREWILEKAQV